MIQPVAILKLAMALAMALWFAAIAVPSAFAQAFVFPQYRGAAQIEEACQRLLADQKADEQRLAQMPLVLTPRATRPATRTRQETP